MADCVFSKLPNGEGEISGLRVNVQEVTLGTYATGGFVIGPGKVAMGHLHGVQFLGWDTSGQGYVPQWNFETGKLMMFQSAAITPAGTINTPTITVTEGAVNVIGGTLGEATGINPDTNAGVLSKAAATNRVIPRATYFGSATTAASSALTFTGTAGSKAPLVEVANSTDLTALRGHFMFVGY